MADRFRASSRKARTVKNTTKREPRMTKRRAQPLESIASSEPHQALPEAKEFTPEIMRKRTRKAFSREMASASGTTDVRRESSMAVVPHRTVDGGIQRSSETKELGADALYRAFTSGLTGNTLELMNAMNHADQPNVLGLSQFYVEDFEKRMHAEDPVERLLIEQILLTQHRSLILSMMAAAAAKGVNSTTASMTASLNQQCDQAANTLRKLVLALAEYRQPRQTMFAQNINAAHQQIVNQDFRNARKKKRRTN